MTKSLLAVSFCTLFITACSSSSDTPATDNTPDADPTNTEPTEPEPNNGDNTPGIQPSFGDSASVSNGVPASTTVCPATVTSSSTGWALNDGTWCAFKCPADHIDDGDDDWGFITSDQSICHVTTAAAGSDITAQLFPPAGGDDEIFVSASADPSDGSSYICTSWLYNEANESWGQEGSTYSLTLSANNSGVDTGTATTWSFNNGILTLESDRILTNVSVVDGAFSSWQSNTALTRCST